VCVSVDIDMLVVLRKIMIDAPARYVFCMRRCDDVCVTQQEVRWGVWAPFYHHQDEQEREGTIRKKLCGMCMWRWM
jgi:hypothetical protein